MHSVYPKICRLGTYLGVLLLLISAKRVFAGDLHELPCVDDLKALIANAPTHAREREEKTNLLVDHLHMLPCEIITEISHYVMPNPITTLHPFDSLNLKVKWLSLSKSHARKYEQEIRDALDVLCTKGNFNYQYCAQRLQRYNYVARHNRLKMHIQNDENVFCENFVKLCRKNNKYINWNYSWATKPGEVRRFLEIIPPYYLGSNLFLDLLEKKIDIALVKSGFITLFGDTPDRYLQAMKYVLLHGLCVDKAAIKRLNDAYYTMTPYNKYYTKLLVDAMSQYGISDGVDDEYSNALHPDLQPYVRDAQITYQSHASSYAPSAWIEHCYQQQVEQQLPLLYRHLCEESQQAKAKRLIAQHKTLRQDQSHQQPYVIVPRMADASVANDLFTAVENLLEADKKPASFLENSLHAIDTLLDTHINLSTSSCLRSVINIPHACKVPLLKKFLAYGADHTIKDKNSHTLLHDFIRYRYIENKYWVEHLADVSQADLDTLRILLAHDANYRAALQLSNDVSLSKKPLINDANEVGQIPLLYVLFSIDYGENVHTNKYLWPVIELLLGSNDLDIASEDIFGNVTFQRILEKICDGPDGYDDNARIACMRALVATHGTHPLWKVKDSKDSTYWTSLLRDKIGTINSAYIEPLLEAGCFGANDQVVHWYGDIALSTYPLHLAVKAQKYALAQVLMKHNADLSLQDGYGQTALELARHDEKMLSILKKMQKDDIIPLIQGNDNSIL